MRVEEINAHLTAAVIAHHKARGIYKGSLYRDIRNCQLATIYYIEEQPYKNEAICYLVKHKPHYIPKLCRDYITIDEIEEIENNCPEIYYCLPLRMYNTYPELINLLASNKLVLYDLLPKEVRKDSRIQEIFKRTKRIYNDDLRDKLGYDFDWLDENGNLKHFFSLKNDFPIENKEDYLKIVEVYLSSNLSVAAFCNKYGISSIDGFNALLNRAGAENIDVGNDIDEVKDAAMKRYLATIKSVAQEFDEGKINFDEYLTLYYNPYHKFELLFNNIDNKGKLMNQILQHIVDNKEHLMLDRFLRLFNTDIKGLIPSINLYFKFAGTWESNVSRTLYPILNMYKTPYNRNNILTTLTINGVTRVIDDKVVDEAVTYLKDNNIHLCQYTAASCARKIAFGELDYSSETLAQRQELINEIISRALSNVNGIEGYMSVMEENYHNRVK